MTKTTSMQYIRGSCKSSCLYFKPKCNPKSNFCFQAPLYMTLLSKRPLDRLDFTDSIVKFIGKLCQTIRCIIVRNFAKLREHRHLLHKCFVLFRLVLFIKEIEPFDVRRILDDSRQFALSAGRALATDRAVIALLPKHTVYTIAVFIATIISFTSVCVQFMLNNFSDRFRLGDGFIAIIENNIGNKHRTIINIGDGTGCKIAAAPSNIFDHELTIRFPIRQNTVEIPQFVGRE